MSPPSLLDSSEPEMIKQTLTEAAKLGLVTLVEGRYVLTPSVRAAFPNGHFTTDGLRAVLRQLIFSPENAENHDLAKLLAWFMAQEPSVIVGTENGLDKALREQTGDNRMGLMSGVRYGNFGFWAVYLGFAWKHSSPGVGKALVPDPSTTISTLLPTLFSGVNDDALPIIPFCDRLADLCPVLPGGSFGRDEPWEQPAVFDETLAPTVANAFLSLQERAEVELLHLADAGGVVFREGRSTNRITHVRYTGGSVL
jgi:hypothetical protein